MHDRKTIKRPTMKLLCKITAPIILSCLVLTGCARNMESDVYTSNATVGKVLEGKVISARTVTIKESDKLAQNQAGALGGGLAGGVAGSAIGAGSGNTAATIGGAIIGAIAGAFIEDTLSTSEGMQYIVRIDPKHVSQVPSKTKHSKVTVNHASVDDDIKQSISVENTRSDLISVVQGKDVIFQAGQRVLIIYNNDRPRITSIN